MSLARLTPLPLRMSHGVARRWRVMLFRTIGLRGARPIRMECGSTCRCSQIEIGDENQFGPDVYIADSNHRYGPGIVGKREAMDVGHVKIGNGCWIGAKAVILKDVELGDRCVVGAGAVVTKSFPADSVIVGVPGRSRAQE